MRINAKSDQRAARLPSPKKPQGFKGTPSESQDAVGGVEKLIERVGISTGICRRVDVAKRQKISGGSGFQVGDKSKCGTRSRVCTATEGRVGKVYGLRESNRKVCKLDGLNGRGTRSLDFVPFFYACTKATVCFSDTQRFMCGGSSPLSYSC